VNEAFSKVSECCLCDLESKAEEDYIKYVLGASLMEPDGREETNEKGFCRRHYAMAYNSRLNTQGLGLIMETYLQGVSVGLSRAGFRHIKTLGGGKPGKARRNSDKDVYKAMQSFAEVADHVLRGCVICERIVRVMERYVDVTCHLYVTEEDFRERFRAQKGFCMTHFRMLMMLAAKYVKGDMTDFVSDLAEMQTESINRLLGEVSWFTQKYDYRNRDAPWGDSKDALPRSIMKMAKYMELDM